MGRKKGVIDENSGTYFGRDGTTRTCSALGFKQTEGALHSPRESVLTEGFAEGRADGGTVFQWRGGGLKPKHGTLMARKGGIFWGHSE